jgi:alkylated DNA repair dioxygenase AlkB
MDLFADEVRLFDDAEGGIRYWPNLVEPRVAQHWFDTLFARVPWASERRPMYDRVVDVPRLLAAYPTDELPGALLLAEMLDAVRARVPAPYSAVGLNLYRDGSDSVAMHNDKLQSIAARQPIALLSLGAPRRMLIRAKEGASEGFAIELAPGSLLSMSHASQLTHEHGIPKTKRAVGARISVVFRVRPGMG